MLESLAHYFHAFVDYAVMMIVPLGYPGIFILMTIESSFIPFPSEIVLIPAGAAVKQGEMNALMVFFAGTAGSLCGAIINYLIAYKLGRAMILKYGNYFFINEEKFKKVEEKFLTHGNFVTFVGRLIFGIRQLISIPAGIVKMPLSAFCFYTALGAGIWSAVLISLGYIIGDFEFAKSQAKTLGLWVLGFVLFLSVAYYYWCSPKKAARKAVS